MAVDARVDVGLEAPVTAGSHVRIDTDSATRVGFDPFASALALGCASARDFTQGRNTPLARLALQMSERSLRAIARMVAPGFSVSPDFLTPAEPGRAANIADQLERLRTLTATEVNEDFTRTFRHDIPPHWQPVVDRPRPWLADLTEGLGKLWTHVEPAWRREANLRHREADRVGAAAARGELDLALAHAHPRGRIVDGRLAFPDPDPVSVATSGRTLILTPMLHHLDVAIANLERSDVVWLAYPAPAQPDPAADPAGLDALLTPIRAALLRQITGKHIMSDVAAKANLARSAATYHIDALTAAGLVIRHRHGRHTFVQRTLRGDTLIELYDRD